LWILGGELAKCSEIYPPAWQARGIDLERLSVAYSQNPMDELKEAFVNTVFGCVVLDSVKLKRRDFVFLAHRARQLQKTILVVQNFYLSSKQGNIWARYRMNCVQHSLGLALKMIRGGEPRFVEIQGVS
jgi:hypothetical protein